MELPDNPKQWRRTFRRLGWPVDVEPYDILLMNGDFGFHMTLAADEKEMIHANHHCRQVVIEPILKYSIAIRTAFRLR
jgi:hypothetical protein